MIRYICDRCKEDCSEEYKNNRISFVTLKKYKPYYYDDDNYKEEDKMLCKQCTSLLEHFLETP